MQGIVSCRSTPYDIQQELDTLSALCTYTSYTLQSEQIRPVGSESPSRLRSCCENKRWHDRETYGSWQQ